MNTDFHFQLLDVSMEKQDKQLLCTILAWKQLFVIVFYEGLKM